MLVFFTKEVDRNDPERSVIWKTEKDKIYSWDEIRYSTMLETPQRYYDESRMISIEVDKKDVLNRDLAIVYGTGKTVELLDEEYFVSYNMTTADFVDAAKNGKVADGKVLGPFKISAKGVRKSLTTV